jgi:hypothetical protein
MSTVQIKQLRVTLLLSGSRISLNPKLLLLKQNICALQINIAFIYAMLLPNKCRIGPCRVSYFRFRRLEVNLSLVISYSHTEV